jgi:hypothetical protein
LSASMAPTTPEDVAYMKDKPYANATGALSYLSNVTRPDIAYAVGVLCRFNSNPGPQHWKAVARDLNMKHRSREIKKTKNQYIVQRVTAS